MDALKRAILSGDLPPNEILIERRIATMLNVSKTPVREALIALSASGLLTNRSRRMAVRELTREDVLHIYEERVLLEPWASATAVGADGTDLADAVRAVEDSRSVIDVDDVRLALANRQFHRALYSRCQNAFVVRTLDQLQDLTALAVTGVLWKNWPTWRQELDEHRAILDAAQHNDSARVHELMHEHIESSLVRLRAM